MHQSCRKYISMISGYLSSANW